MTLAARCPACGTVFRVVQDQLRVSEGWVRCGRCAEVFNAIDTLVEIETDLPPKPPAQGPSAQRVLSELARVAKASDLDQRPLLPRPVPPAPSPVRSVPPPPAPAVAAPVAVQAMDPPLETETSEPPAAPPASAGIDVEPAFVRRAEQAARWRRPQVRAALGVAALVLTSTLVLQSLMVYRDAAAARWPGLRPALEQACAVAGCSVGPLHAIDALAVDSSGLVRIDGTSLYRLTVVLRNRSPLPVAVPAIDLTLTDSQGGVLARRVLSVQELGNTQTYVAAATNLSLQAALGGPERPISGYTIEIFYP